MPTTGVGTTGGGGEVGAAASTSTVTVTSSATVGSTTSMGADAAPPCPDGATEGLPAGIPPCWQRLPTMPAGCDVYFAPSAEYAKPPSPWAPCGDGCLELVNDWSADPKVRLYAVTGGSANGVRYIGYKRMLKYLETDEMQIIRLPENRVEFNAISLDASHDVCATGGVIAGPHGHVMEYTYEPEPNSPSAIQKAWFIHPGEPVPMLSYEGPRDSGFLYPTISESLWAFVHQGAVRMTWHGIDFAPELQPLYKDGSVLFAPASYKNDVFFSTWGGISEVFAWDPVGGPRKLVSFPSKSAGGACCLATDGKNMAWLQGTKHLGNDVYEKMELMTAPYAAQAATFKPKSLRPAYQNTVLDGAIVLGGDYVAGREAILGTHDARFVVTRLSDGAYWVISPRENMQWSQALYVDNEEVAIVEQPAPGHGDLVKAGNVWTIVRRTIASLGEPKKPGDGF